jgi:glycosyltransferase involved in cell wall biosynthesis
LRTKVSVVIPVHNAEGTVREAVSSMLEQSLPPYEVIVVDDGSTDGTREVLDSFGGAIRVIRQPNRGLAAARTAGQQASTGEYIAWLDADDVSVPERLAVQLGVFETEPAVVVAASDFDLFGGGSARRERSARHYYDSIEAEGSLERVFGSPKSVEVGGRAWQYFVGEAREALLLGNFLHPPTVMMRRSAAERAGPLRGTFPVAEDWLYLLVLAGLGQVAWIDEPLVAYRRSPDQMSRGGAIVVLNNLRSLEHVLAGEPEFVAANRARIRTVVGRRHRDIAEVLAESDAGAAFRHLLSSIRGGDIGGHSVRIFAKIVLPNVVIGGLRRVRAR